MTEIVPFVSTMLGIITLAAAIIGIGITWGQHVQADTDQAAQQRQIELRIDRLERTHDYNHPNDVKLFEPHEDK